MEIRIFSPDGRFSGICDRVIRFRAEEEFAGAGQFTLRVPVGEAERFLVDSILLFPLTEEAFMVESLRTDRDAGICEVSGRGILSCFARRILTEKITFMGAAEELLCRLAADWGSAVLPASLRTEETGADGVVNVGLSHRSLLGAMQDIAAEAGVGVRLRFLPAEREFLFSLRAYRRGTVMLSPELGNLAGICRTEDLSRYVNRIYVAGNGGHTVCVHAAGLFTDGIDDASLPLREAWENAEDLAMERYASAEEYRAALEARGKRILAQRRPQITVRARTDSATAARLRLGEICPIRDPAIAAEAVCVGRSVIYEDGGTVCRADLALRRA